MAVKEAGDRIKLLVLEPKREPTGKPLIKLPESRFERLEAALVRTEHGLLVGEEAKAIVSAPETEEERRKGASVFLEAVRGARTGTKPVVTRREFLKTMREALHAASMISNSPITNLAVNSIARRTNLTLPKTIPECLERIPEMQLFNLGLNPRERTLHLLPEERIFLAAISPTLLRPGFLPRQPEFLALTPKNYPEVSCGAAKLGYHGWKDEEHSAIEEALTKAALKAGWSYNDFNQEREKILKAVQQKTSPILESRQIWGGLFSELNFAIALLPMAMRMKELGISLDGALIKRALLMHLELIEGSDLELVKTRVTRDASLRRDVC